MVYVPFDLRKPVFPVDQPWEQQRLVFVVGDFAQREELRQGLCYVPPNHPSGQPYAPRWNWIEGTFAAYQDLKEEYQQKRRDFVGKDYPFLSRVNFPNDAMFYFQFRNKVLLITRDVQDGLRAEIRKLEEAGRASDERYGHLPISHGLIPYALGLNSQIVREYQLPKGRPAYPDAFSIVVDETPVSDLERAVSVEFADGADVFVSGARTAEEYLDLARAFAGKSINPRKYKGMVFNKERFTETRGLLVPKNSY